MKLTKNFYLKELTISQTASREGIDNSPTAQHTIELNRLCSEIAQPLRDKVARPILITSGYRSKKLNKRIKGSKTSQHCFGQAMDFHINGFTIPEICQIIIEMDLPYHQLIDEFSDNGGGWVHVSIAPEGQKPKKQFMTARKNKYGKTVYKEVT